MRFLCLAAVVALLAPALSAQTVPERGSDDTFEVASWNIEHFGDPGFAPSDALQLQNAEAIIAQSGIDLWAIQEIGTAGGWSDLLTALQDDGYTGRLGPETPGSFQLRLGFIYNPDVVQVIGTRTILSGGNFGGRAPFELQARVTIDGESRTIRVIDVHAKAGTSSSDYSNRQSGAVALQGYIDGRIALGEDVIVLGDFNDFLTRSTRIGQPSPYRGFIDNPDYVAATLGIENLGQPTLCQNDACTSGSTRDHIVFSASLADEYVEGSGDRFIEVVSGVSGYTSTTSDHLPVLAAFSFRSTAAEEAPLAGLELLPFAPNPSRGDVRLRFRLDAPSDVRLEIFDALGRRVASAVGPYGAGAHALSLDGAALSPGTYTVRLAAAGTVRTGLLVRVR